MSRFLVFSLLTGLFLLAMDYLVYRHWRGYVRDHPRLGWTLPLYRLFLWAMPWVLPLYFAFSRWWEVEPRWIRAFIVGFWAFYYLPKALMAIYFLCMDVARLLLRPARRRRPEATSSPMTRKEFLRTLGWATAGIPYILTARGMLTTLYDFQIHHQKLAIKDLPRALEGLRIVQLSDLHAGSLLSPRPMEAVVSETLALAPDLIVITGDYVNHRAEELAIISPALQQLRAPLGVYGCLGNHDHYAPTERVIEGVEASGIRLLVNAHHTFAIDGAYLHLIGTDNTGFGQHFGDLRKATEGLIRHPHGEEFTLLLAHDPSFWDRYVRPGYPYIDLMLCGHTHGGQLGIELGPLRWSLARLAYERWAGLYVEPADTPRGRQWLYVNRGVGTVGPPIRLGIRPEITLITLHRR